MTERSGGFMSVKTTAEIEFSKELIAFIEEWKTKPGNLIMVLHKVQEEFGYIKRQAAIKVSDMLDVPLAKVYGVITFYHFFKTTKPGKYNIQVCMGTACYLRGGYDLIQELENLLGIGVNQVTDDGIFSIESVRCVGCCGLAPVAIVGGEVFGKLDKDSLPEILATYRNKG
jgi:NADH-quinone oxidoreductase subunit E